MPANKQDRRGFIGGTDVMRIMKGDWLTLYKEKMGEIEPVDLDRNFKVQLGKVTEPFHRDWLAYQLSTIIEPCAPIECKVGNVPCRASVDAIAPAYKQRTFVELKHTGGNYSILEEAHRYMPQVQFYLMAGDFDRCVFSVIRGTEEPEHVIIEPAEDYRSNMMKRVHQFWGHVESQIPPIDTSDWSAEDDKLEKAARIVPIDGMISKDMTTSNSWMNDAGVYLANEEAAKNFEASKAALKELMPADAYEAFGGGIIMKRAKNGSLRITKEK